MAWAANGRISQSPIVGGIEITQQQYADALAGMQVGKIVTIDGGFSVDYPATPEPEPAPDPEPPLTIEQHWQYLRDQRDVLLTTSDWTQLPDAPVDAEAWAVYRQALRDLPEATTDPANPEWPNEP